MGPLDFVRSLLSPAPLPALLPAASPIALAAAGVDDDSVVAEVLADDGDKTIAVRVNGRTIRTADAYSADVVRGLLSDVQAGSIGSRILSGVLGWSNTAPRRGTVELTRAYRRSPHLRSVVGRIAQSMSSVRWRTFASPKSGKRDTARMIRSIGNREERRAEAKKATKKGDLVEIPNHPALQVIDGGNSRHSGLVVRRLGQIYQELKGEQFHALDFNAAGIPVMRWPIPTHWVRRTPTPSEPWFEINFLGTWERIPEASILWMCDPDPENPYSRGTGIGETLADEWETDEHAAKHLNAWFKNHAMASHLIGIKGGGADDDVLDEAEARWNEKHRGPQRNNRVHWHNGELDVVRLDDKFADMQIVDVRKYEATIGRETFNVPPEVVGHLDNSNKAAIVEALKFFGVIVVVPRCEFERAEYQSKLIPLYPDADRVMVDYDDPVPVDKAFALEVAKVAPFSVTVNEWRALRGAEEEEGGDVRFVPISLVPLRGLKPKDIDGLDEEPEPAPAPGAAPAPKPGAPKALPAPTSKATSPLRPQDIQNVLEAFRPEYVREETDPVTAALVEDFGQAAFDELGVTAGAFNASTQAVADHLQAEGATRITGMVGDTTRQAIRDELTAGVAAGEGIDPLAARMRAVFDQANKTRSVNIARTEVVRAANFGRWQGQAQTGIVQTRKWHVNRDGRERDSHATMQGQVRAISSPFHSGAGHAAMHPGAFGVASEDCQCRCTTLPVIAAPRLRDVMTEAEREQAIYRSFDRRCARWEEVFEVACRRGFNRQLSEVMTALLAFAPRA